MSPGYCWPSLGEPYGGCHRCGPPEPQPCEGCFYVYGDMRECDGGCNGLTSAEDAERRAAMFADPEGRTLVQRIIERKNHEAPANAGASLIQENP
jgi:hypothetical protein